jgi:hypothetical protein
MKGKKLRKRRKANRKRYPTREPELRILVLPTPQGLREIAVLGDRQASMVGTFWNSVHRYLESGDASALGKFEGKRITDAKGVKVALLTDLAELDRLGSAGVLSFESIYARSS